MATLDIASDLATLLCRCVCTWPSFVSASHSCLLPFSLVLLHHAPLHCSAVLGVSRGCAAGKRNLFLHWMQTCPPHPIMLKPCACTILLASHCPAHRGGALARAEPLLRVVAQGRGACLGARHEATLVAWSMLARWAAACLFDRLMWKWKCEGRARGTLQQPASQGPREGVGEALLVQTTPAT